MKSFKIIAIALLIIVTNSCNNTKNKQGKSLNRNNEINTYLQRQLEFQEMPSLALAVVKNGDVIYEGYFENADLGNTTSIDKNTIYPIYSVTKLMVTTGVFQLIEQNKISLDDYISKHINNLPESWKSIKIKHLLTHSTGLPDISFAQAEKSDEEMWNLLIKKDRHFDLGYKFEYNQTNYWILAKIIEKITNLSFEKYIINNQFKDVNSGLVFSSDFVDSIPNRVKRYDYNSTQKKYINLTLKGGKRFHPANGLNSTLKNLIQWNKQLDDNKLLNESTKRKMWMPFKYNDSTSKFQHGWHNYPLKNINSYGFAGGAHTGFRKFTEKDITIILLTNGYKYYPNYNEIINHIAGIVDNDLKDEKTDLKNKITYEFLMNDFNKAFQTYEKLKSKKLYKITPSDFERTLNQLGYILINHHKTEKAIKVFELNTQEHPESANCYNSLGEAYFNNKQLKLALHNFKKAVKLNPSDSYAKKMIKKIEK